MISIVFTTVHYLGGHSLAISLISRGWLRLVWHKKVGLKEIRGEGRKEKFLQLKIRGKCNSIDFNVRYGREMDLQRKFPRKRKLVRFF